MSESGPQGQPDEAMLDLLIKQATEGLSPAEQRELDVIDSAAASVHARGLERAAAAVALAAVARDAGPPPAALTAKIEAQAQVFFTEQQAGAARAPGGPSATPARPAPYVAPVAARPRRTLSGLGWWAAAACLVAALFGWLRSPGPSEPPVAEAPPAPPVVAPVVPTPEAPVPPTPAEERAALLADATSIKATLAATKDPAAAGVTGDVVWNPATQRGYLRFVGLKPNDPLKHQYQVWIFDGTRDQRYPVDGGVFDIPADATEVVIPFHASLPVQVPKAFAVTVEKAGGVVVSGREHLIVLGAVT